MKLTILTTITNPIKRQDKVVEAIKCYTDIADEVVIVDGGKEEAWFPYELREKVRWVFLPWPKEWNWVELPKHLNAGLEQCTGDWVIKLDIDQFFHEIQINNIRTELKNAADYPLARFSKFTPLTPTKAYQKGYMTIAINRNYADTLILFGEVKDKRTDLCQPIEVTGYKKVDGYNLPVGNKIEMISKGVKKEFAYRTGIHYFNYDYFFKEVDFAIKEFKRFEDAYLRYFGMRKFKSSQFIEFRKNQIKKADHTLKLEQHPKYIRKAVKESIKNKKLVCNL